MRIGSLAVFVFACCGLCLACSGGEAEPPEASAAAQSVEEESAASTPEFAIQKLSPRKAEARETIEARLSRAERRLDKRRDGQEPAASGEFTELESKTTEARALLGQMEEVRGSEWDSLLVELERAVEAIERGLDS